MLAVALLLGILTITQVVGAVSATAPVQPQAEISACGTISSPTTWTSDNVYVANGCSITVGAGVTLTVQAGTTVKFLGGEAALIVNGSLAGQGTVAQPIVFSSLHDDAHGQAAAGSSSSPAAEDWYGIYFASGSSGQISHAFIGYGTVYAAHSVLGWNEAHIFVDDAAIAFDNVEIAHGHRPGIYLTEGSSVQITDSYIHDHANTTTYPYAPAIYQESINMQPVYSNLTFSGNTRNEVTIDLNTAMAQSATLGGTKFGFICSISTCAFTVPGGLTLTVEPGTSLDFRSTYGFMVADGGSLIAEGTAAQPITFTSQLAAGGDAGQYWYGLWAKQGSTLRLDHCDVSYASDSNFGTGGLEIATTDAQVSNTHVHHNSGHGLYLNSPNASTIHPVLTNVEVTDNGSTGVALATSSGSTTAVTWDGGGSRRNGWSGLASDTWNSTANPTLRNLTIADNGAAGGAADRQAGLYLHAHNVNPTLENLTLTGNAGSAIHWHCNGSITALNLTATGNGSNALTLPGCDVSGGRRWDLADAGIPAHVTADIAVTNGGLLSLSPGTALRFDKNWAGSPTTLKVGDQAALYALGTATRPITFTGDTQTPGWWTGIRADYGAELVLHHCDVSYGGASYANLRVWGYASGVPALDLQNCAIHHSATKGMHIDLGSNPLPAPYVFRHNHLHDNAAEAVTNWWAPPLDARENYWGDPSGPYHATQNPDGLGGTVGDNVLFYPWLDAPSTGAETPGEMLLSTGAPSLVSPGQTVDFVVQYLNAMTTTVENALLVVQLPRAAEYVESDGGIYWSERDQLFWLLGDLAPGAQDYLGFSLRFAWGLSRDYQDSTITLFTADNYNAGELDVQPYLDYQAGEVSNVALLSQGDFDAARAASPKLEAAYQAALADGYTFHSAAYVTRSQGEVILEAVLYDTPRRAARFLTQESGNVLIYTVTGSAVTIEDATGGMRLDMTTGEKSAWGTWDAGGASSTSLRAPGQVMTGGCTVDACKSNCRWSIIGWTYIKNKAKRIVAWTVLAPFTGGGSLGGYIWEFGSTAKKIWDCDLDCRANPQAYCCTEGQTRWNGSGLFDRMTNSCFKDSCNATTGTWYPSGYESCVGKAVCVAGIRSGSTAPPGCTPCKEGYQQMSNAFAAGVSVTQVDGSALAPMACSVTASGDKPNCRDLRLLLAKDPNAIYGPEGDLLPGQTVTYTLTYENEGAGRAYGVYVVNELPEVFDAGTLSFTHGGGTYLPESREIFWLVGELGPKGAADSEGAITYTVALTDGLPSGTVVSNQAVVYFPSVPEETPTNSWVNQVSPLVAVPQALTTDYVTPLSITLSGRDVSAQPLSYEIVDPPHGGLLTGTLPDITYTPVENFTGPGVFTFRVSNGVTTSNPAQVYLTVTREGDLTPPQVIWTHPAADAADVFASPTPVLTDTLGPIYPPIVLIGVSEALSATTVTSATVTLRSASGTSVLASVDLEGGTNQIAISPRAALISGETYTITVSSDVHDIAGNPLAHAYRASFSTVDPAPPNHLVYLPIILR
jgi:uncharacterized repeat protein (TIGR01451 family)